MISGTDVFLKVIILWMLCSGHNAVNVVWDKSFSQIRHYSFILAQEVDGSWWFLILAAPGTLSRTLSALPGVPPGSSRASWSGTRAEMEAVKKLFYFFDICTSFVESSVTSG